MSTPASPISSAPAAAAAPAVASPSPSPAATPSSPAAVAPVTPSPAVTPVTPSATVPMDSDARQKAMVDHLAEASGTKPAEPVVEKPAVETPAVEVKADETPASDAQQDTDAFTLEEDGFVGAKDLASKIDADPALKAAIPQELRNEILANARIAERLAPYQELFASPEEAKVISETANEHAGYAEAYSLIGRDTEKGTDAFVQKLIKGSALRDADGNILKNAQGGIMTDGTAGKFFDKIFERGFAMKVAKKVEALKNENVTAAFDLVMESVGLRPSTAAQDLSQDPALAARKAELDAREASIVAKDRAARTEAQNQHKASFDSQTKATFDTSVSDLVGKATALSTLEQGTVKAQIEQAFAERLKRGNPASTAYWRNIDRIRQEPLSAGRLQKELAEAARFTRDNLVRVSRPILAEAGVSVGKKAEERAAAQAARAESARSEVSGGRAASPAGAGTGDAAQMEARAVEAFKAANGGREPSDEHEKRLGMMLATAKSRGIAA